MQINDAIIKKVEDELDFMDDAATLGCFWDDEDGEVDSIYVDWRTVDIDGDRSVVLSAVIDSNIGHFTNTLQEPVLCRSADEAELLFREMIQDAQGLLGYQHSETYLDEVARMLREDFRNP